MQKQPVVIKVWCRGEDLQRTASLLSWTVGHRVEIPTEVAGSTSSYFFVITEIEEYEDEKTVLATMGFDIISKVSGVIDWEILPHESAPSSLPSDEVSGSDESLLVLLNGLPIPISIVQRNDGSYAWKWQMASGQAATCMEAINAVLTHVMKSYSLIRKELMG